MTYENRPAQGKNHTFPIDTISVEFEHPKIVTSFSTFNSNVQITYRIGNFHFLYPLICVNRLSFSIINERRKATEEKEKKKKTIRP